MVTPGYFLLGYPFSHYLFLFWPPRLSLFFASDGPSPSLMQSLPQMCTNKKRLKQNESKQTNGIRLTGVGGLGWSDKHSDAERVFVCVFVRVCAF